jgi:hypothetical protein
VLLPTVINLLQQQSDLNIIFISTAAADCTRQATHVSFFIQKPLW